MHLDSALDSLYVLGTLWATLTGTQVCSPNFPALPRVAHEVAQPPMAGSVTAFVDVNVVPMDREQVLAQQTVLVEGGRITSLGPSDKITVPAEAMRIDGRGKYLMPGLGDMHVHGLQIKGDTIQTPLGNLFHYLADGVTTLRTLAENRTGLSVDELQRLRRLETSPRLYLARAFRESTRPDSLAAYVAAAKAAGYNHIGLPYLQFRSDDDRVFFDSLLAAARRVDFRVSAHAHRLPFDAVLALGTTGGAIDHPSSVFWDTLGLRSSYTYPENARQPVDVPLAQMPPLVAAVQRAGLWITPTLDCMERIHPHVKGIPQVVKALHDGGVGLLLAGDDGGNVHDELAALVRAGLTPYEALRTGTHNVAQYFGRLDSSGTVAVGKWADLVLLAGNPLADIRHTREPAGVMIRGQWLDRATLDQRLLASRFIFRPWLLGALRNWNFKSVEGQKPLEQIIAQRDTLEVHEKKLFYALTDSLVGAPSSASQRVRRRIAAELGAMRALLWPEQHETFDAIVRVWLREQARQGHGVTVTGVTLTP